MLQINYGRPSLYNPATQTDAEIISNFVVRLQEFSDLFEEIKRDKMNLPPQHYLVQAQRGYGKTTLLLRLKIEVERDQELNQWLIPVMFDEEQYGIRTLSGFWEEIIQNLPDSNPEFSDLLEQIDNINSSKTAEEQNFNLLETELKKQNKKLLLLVDNFGELLDKFSHKEIQRLREVLITSSYIRLIGVSSAMLEYFYEHKEPFYNFFKIIQLDELTKDETINLLKKLSETYRAEEVEEIINNQPQRIEALRRLTGGVPRTIVLLFEIFVDDKNGNSIQYLEKILDYVTPLYKYRLDDLSKQQQVIIDAVAQAWDAVSTKEIAEATGMSAKAISAQLNQLEKNQLIKKIPTSTKNHLYQLNERFFNIYYLMRVGRKKNRKRVIWLVKFFEMWCDKKVLENKVRKHIAALKEERLNEKHTFYVSQALASTNIDPELQHELLTEAGKSLSERNSIYYQDLIKSHYEVIDAATEEIIKGNINSAEILLAEDGFDLPGIHSLIGFIYHKKVKDLNKAKEFYEMAIGNGESVAMFNLGFLYENELNNSEKAKIYYKLAAEKGNVAAMNSLGFMYQERFRNYKEAKKYFEMAEDKGDTTALVSLAFLLFIENSNKVRSLQLIQEAVLNDTSLINNMLFIAILLWNNEINSAISRFNELQFNEDEIEESYIQLSFVIIMFIAQKQYHFIYNVFKENKLNIRDIFKPLYYALLFLMGSDYNDEYLKMGDELKETVNEILTDIKETEKKYFGR